jgi:DnaJ-domain-containing protein 1
MLEEEMDSVEQENDKPNGHMKINLPPIDPETERLENSLDQVLRKKDDVRSEESPKTLNQTVRPLLIMDMLAHSIEQLEKEKESNLDMDSDSPTS